MGRRQRAVVTALAVIAVLFASRGWGDDGQPASDLPSEDLGSAPTRPSPQPIEEALGESGSPLEAVAVDIENAEYAKAEAFLTPYLRNQHVPWLA